MLALLLLACHPADPCATRVDVDGATVTLDGGECGTTELTATVLGEGDLTVALDETDAGVIPTISGTGTFAALMLRGPLDLPGEGAPVLWRQGYQSWSWSGVVALEPPEWDDGLPDAGGDGDAFSLLAETPGTSWWVGLLGRPDAAVVALGALGATRTKVLTAWDADEAAVILGGRGEQIAVTPSDPLVLDEVGAWYGTDPNAVLGAYARAVPHRRPPRDVPAGWATWYTFYRALDADDVASNLALTADLVDGGAPLGLFQVDDGWQVRWGDWTANDRFPQGIDGLASEIRAAGFTPGLWMAPFYVHRKAPAYLDHRDWWVRDASGAELTFSNAGTGDYAVIDVTHPDAAAWLHDQIAARVDEGFGYLKLDFLYAGAQEGLRHDDVTGMEAYHRGLSILRDAAGDAWILACGAPLLPTVGFADSYRSGADIAFEIAPDPRRSYVRSETRSTAARSFAAGVWWWNDPDQLLVRAPLTPAEARGAVVAQAVSGGPWLLGDDLATLPADRLDLALTAAGLARRGQPAVPLDPLRHVSGFDAGPTVEAAQDDDDVPTRWAFPDGTVVTLNLSDVPVTVDGTPLEPGEGAGLW